MYGRDFLLPILASIVCAAITGKIKPSTTWVQGISIIRATTSLCCLSAFPYSLQCLMVHSALGVEIESTMYELIQHRFQFRNHTIETCAD